MIALWAGCYWISADDLAVRADRDGDGHAATQFGGDDCDDDEPLVWSGCDSPPSLHTGTATHETAAPPPIHSGPTELVCDDGVDDDDDGYTDCADADCHGDPTCEAELVVNEVFVTPDPMLLDGNASDANCDGLTTPTWMDQFVELVNVGAVPVVIAGASLSDQDAVRYSFPAAAEPVPPGGVVVLFGGGTWGPAGGGALPNHPWCDKPPNAAIFVADGLSLSPSDRLTFRLPDLEVQVDYSNAPRGESLNREPDLEDSPFERHGNVNGADGSFSPMRRVDLSEF